MTGWFSGDHHTDYYQVLHVSEDATQQEIVAAFHSLVRQYHPDTAKEPDPGSQRFKQIYEAYRVLADPELRRRYDRARQQHRRRTVPVRTVPGTACGPVCDAPAPLPLATVDLRTDLPITPEESWYGTRCEVRVRRQLDCPHCRPPRPRRPWSASVCDHCRGSGRVWTCCRLPVYVPPGTPTGTLLAFPGYGHQLPGEQQYGNLVLRVVVRPCW